MKKIAFFTLLCALFSFSSCDMFKLDNYDEPEETLQGEVVDVATGEPVYTTQGHKIMDDDKYKDMDGIRVRLTELSWGENATHNPDFYCMSDGTFQNTKLFKGYYHVTVDGPFIPLIREDERGVPLADESKEMDIKGVTKVRFEVQPFLRIEWVGEPTISNGKVTARIRVVRGVSEDEFRKKIEPMGSYSSSFLNVTDIRLFVSYSSSVGQGVVWDADGYDPWSGEIKYTGSEFNPLLGEVITIESKGTIPSGRTVFIRAAARINYDTPRNSGKYRYNYNQALELMVP